MKDAQVRSLLAALLALAALAVTGCTASEVSVKDLQAGDCLTDSGTAADPNIEVMPCDEAHAFEIFAVTELPEGDYPGTGQADAQAQEFCRGEFEEFVGVAYDESVLELQYFYPVESEWADDGGRTVTCLVGLAGGEPSTGTLEDSER